MLQTLSILYKFGQKISGQGVLRAGEGFTSLISNKDLDDVIKIVDSLEKSDLLIDGVTEKVKREREKQKDGYLWTMMTSRAAILVGPRVLH